MARKEKEATQNFTMKKVAFILVAIGSTSGECELFSEIFLFLLCYTACSRENHDNVLSPHTHVSIDIT